MGIGSSKEGFSVYNMLNKCVTNMGRRWVALQPLNTAVELSQDINHWYDVIE